MKNYLLLTRLMLKNFAASMNPFADRYADGKKKKSGAGKAILFTMLALYGIGFMLWIEIQLFNLVSAAHNALLLPTLAIFLSMLLTLVLGLFQGLSDLYQGKDAPFLATLPVTSPQVFAAKLTSLYVTELLIDAAIALPAFVLYAVKTGRVLPTALTAIPVWLLLPAIPLAAVSLLSALLMRISGFAKHREAVTMVLSMALAIAYSLLITRSNTSDGDLADTLSALLVENGLTDKVASILPPVKWAAHGFAGEVPMLLLFAAACAAAFAFTVILVGPGYLEQALASTEQTTGGKGSRHAREMRSGSVLQALHATEWKRLLRTPAWVFNGLAGVIMFPLMFGVGISMGFAQSGANETFAMLMTQIPPAYIAIFGGLLMAMGSMVNPVVSTAVSREGGNWPFALSLPVRQEDRYMAKLLVGMEINAICSVMIAIVLTVMGGLPLWAVLLALLLSLVIDLAVAAISLWRDAYHPNFRWTNETQAIKQNFNQMWGMLYWLAAIALCCVPMFFLFEQPELLLVLMTAIALAEMVLGCLLLDRSARNTAVLNA